MITGLACCTAASFQAATASAAVAQATRTEKDLLGEKHLHHLLRVAGLNRNLDARVALREGLEDAGQDVGTERRCGAASPNHAAVSTIACVLQ